MKKPRTLRSLCLSSEYEFLSCVDNCSVTLCGEVVPDHIPKEQVLKFIKILSEREDYYFKGNI